ncbi:hypothetical protein [Dinghuibacter silviterrae]|uniref:Protochlamydia outer membrane protein domain-containing protein n=1 Tax=Dinghuibacter silviterrae TaxID=1539049 RepID=A0A4R8DUL4_9BACT|nr:hypothetical protein [Dinghuibacter silviterrae]TDX00851.1 hypothetical protein EDB95_1880 [Dinghuibacter silviterrae]
MSVPRQKLILLCLSLWITLNAHAQQTGHDTGVLQVGIQTGYRSENLRWSIAGNLQGQDPNIYSELIWKSVDGLLCAADVRWKVYRSLELHGHFSMATISGGRATDTDYHGDNRTDVSYYGYFDAGEGNLLSGDIQLGYRLNLGPRIVLIPAFGYGGDQQNLYLKAYEGNAPSTLNSSYTALWKGFLGSMTALIPFGNRWEVDPSIAYHQVVFDGTADWNLITTFQHPVSFRDHANGFGVVPACELLYHLRSHWAISLHGNYGWWKTGLGVDNLYLSNGTTSLTQYNGARRTGGEAGIGFRLTL